MSYSWNIGTGTDISNYDWTGISFTDGGHLAVSKQGYLMSSQFGDNWSIITPPALYNWSAITIFNGNMNGDKYVIVSKSGTGNRVLTCSQFADNFTLRTTPADNNWTSITRGDHAGVEIIVAVSETGTGNRVMTSSNGINWTIRNSAADYEWTSVTYGNGLFVAVAKSGTGNRVMTSPNGINWTLRNTPADNNWSAVKWCPFQELFLAVATSGPANRIMTSPNGINWTLGTSPEANLCQWTAIEHTSPGPNIICIVGSFEGAPRSMVSYNGYDWILIDTANENSNWSSIVYSPAYGRITAVADGGSNDKVMWIDVEPFYYASNPSQPIITNVTAYNQSAIVDFELNQADPTIQNYAYSYSVNGGASFTGFTLLSPPTTTSPLTIPELTNGSIVSVKIRSWSGLFYSINSNIVYNKYVYTSLPVICFKDNTKILTNNGYIQINLLTKDDLVETFGHGFKKITAIGKSQIIHNATQDRLPDQLYKYSKETSGYNELTEDLIITGRHAVLVDTFESDEQKQDVLKMCGIIKQTDNKYHLPACVDNKSDVYEIPGEYFVYHLALENDDENACYGIYANGLLVETCSERYLKDVSNMAIKTL
jgi:hypothetical protein